MKHLMSGLGVGDLSSQQWEPWEVREQGSDKIIPSQLTFKESAFEEAQNTDCGERAVGGAGQDESVRRLARRSGEEWKRST